MKALLTCDNILRLRIPELARQQFLLALFVGMPEILITSFVDDLYDQDS